MFVKIINTKTRATKTLPASEVDVLPDGESFILLVKLGEVETSYPCQRGVHVVYLMNENGRTLDTYRI